MKPTLTSPENLKPLLAFGAHPDDIEFGCGGVIALESRAGRPVHFVVCSLGESASNGTATQRKKEAEDSALLLGAKIDFLELDGDAHLEVHVSHSLELAKIIRRLKPGILLAPTPVANQHPDHARLSTLVREAARLARYGGIAELRDLTVHSVDQLLFYAITVEAEPRDGCQIFVDVSDPSIFAAWKQAMEIHESQSATRNYIELQLTRSRLNGLRAGVDHAISLFPADIPVIDSLAPLSRSARRF